jgi:hypothetical protein
MIGMNGMRADIFIVLILLGFGFGFVLVSVGYPPGEENKVILNSSEFVLWSLLIAFQTSLFAVAALPLWATVKDMKESVDLTNRKGEVGIFIVVLAAMFWLPLLIGQEELLPIGSFRLRLRLVVAAGFIIVLEAVAGLALLRVAFEQFEADDEKGVRTYLRMRHKLDWLITIMGLMLTLGVLATAMLVAAVDVYAKSHPRFNNNLDSLSIIAYGAYLTFILALAYLPAHWASISSGKLYRDRLIEMRAIDDWLAQEDERVKITSILRLRVSAGQTLSQSISVLAPLLGAVFSLILTG